MQSRPYQEKFINEIFEAWAAGYNNVCGVLPTGGGKTYCLSTIMNRDPVPTYILAHRQELVSQLSGSLCDYGIEHNIIAPPSLVRIIVAIHMENYGRSFYNPDALVAAGSVQTLVARNGTGFDGDYYLQTPDNGAKVFYGPRENGRWPAGVPVPDDFEKPVGCLTGKTRPKDISPDIRNQLLRVKRWIIDEAHHVLEHNQWGKVVKMLPNAKGLGPTATPKRADGYGLGSWNDGVFDVMVQGPSLRELVNMGYLTDYVIYSPPSDLDLSQCEVSKKTGDYKENQAAAAVEKSSIVSTENAVVGDVVKHYLKLAPGKLGVTFAPSIAVATEIADQFNSQGVPAKVISSKTGDKERNDILRDLKNRKILQVVNVDLIGEGFDLPAIEVVSLARPTQSFSLFCQQVGRVLRILEGKTEAIIIDHVGNVMRHARVIEENGKLVIDVCYPEWSLEGRDRRKSADADEPIKLTTCLNPDCFLVYEAFRNSCPHCGETPPPPPERSSIDFVDGDLQWLDPQALAQLQGEVANVDKPLIEFSQAKYQELHNKNVPIKYRRSQLDKAEKKFIEQQATTAATRDAMAYFGGKYRALGLADNEIHKLFYQKYGVDWLTAQTLPATKADPMIESIYVEVLQ